MGTINAVGLAAAALARVGDAPELVEMFDRVYRSRAER